MYLLSALSGKRVRFLVAFATFLLAFPVALSYLIFAVSRPGVTVGSSGIATAFVGFLRLALSDFLGVHFEIDGELDLPAALFFVETAPIVVLSVRSPARTPVRTSGRGRSCRSVTDRKNRAAVSTAAAAIP